MISGNLIYTAAVISVGSGFQHGFNIGVLNNPDKIIQNWIKKVTNNPSDDKMGLYWGIIVSIFAIGGLLGASLTGLIGKYLGRKGGLMINNVIAIIAGCLFAFVKSFNSVAVLFIGRLLVGICAGIHAGIGPVYLSEVAPTNIRGALSTLYQLNITISIVLSQIFGFKGLMGTESAWPFLLALVAPVGILQIIGLIFAPESPKYYYETKKNEAKAEEVCKRLWGENYQQQYSELKSDIEDARKLPKVTVKEMFSEKKLRIPLFIICTLMISQQLSGINGAMFYSTEIFKMADFSVSTAQTSTIGMGIVNVLTTVVSVWLIEASGRKPLLLIGFGGMVIALTLLFISLYYVTTSSFMGYMAIIEVYLYVILFAVGAGPIPWAMGPEMFNTGARPIAVSFAVSINWLFTFVVGLAFPVLQKSMGPAVFVIFIVCNIGSFIFTWAFVPETKNKPISEITALFE